jgi:hypothetical protein
MPAISIPGDRSSLQFERKSGLPSIFVHEQQCKARRYATTAADAESRRSLVGGAAAASSRIKQMLHTTLKQKGWPGSSFMAAKADATQ